MRPRSEAIVFALAGVALVVAACGARVVRPGQYPKTQEGIAFIRVKLEGLSDAKVHLFTKGDRFGPHKARIDASGGDDVYAFIIGQGDYDVGQISAGMGTDIWPAATKCPPFRVAVGKNNYAGTLKLRFAYPEYVATCDTSADSQADALAKFRTKYADLASRYPTEPQTR
jgi:hypothetical protein